MKFVVCLVLFFNTFTFGQSFPQISELRGLEDSLNNTHLFYRYVYPFSHCWSKNIYHFDLLNNVDTLFIPDFGYEVLPGWGCEGDYVNDYEFFSDDPAKFIYCGYNLWIDPVALLRRYDGDIQLEAFVLTEIEISNLDESLVYVSAGPGFFKSTDGGYNFVLNDSMQFIDASIISLSKNDDSQIYGINDSKLVRSENDGLSYIIVDNSFWKDNSELFYDADGNHIYGVSISYNYQTHSYHSKIYKSSENGNPFTWNTILEYPAKIWFTLDDIQAGEIYYSAGKQIFKSTDFGNTFILYNELKRKITGLYKKSGTNILYASTPLKIYEITPDSIQVIKSLTIPDEVLNYYPLAVGNKWVYDYIIDPDDPGLPGDVGIYIREVLKDTILANNKFYVKIFDETLNYFGKIVYERVDSATGYVYRYYEYPTLENNEYVIHDLLAEVGDTITSSRNNYGESLFTTVQQTGTFNKWGITKPKKIYQEYSLLMLTYSLTQEVGLDSLYFIFDFGYGRTDIKGAILNGTVYGDTTVVSVKDETPNLPTEFSLSQNYPNPFNPTTTIRFTIPELRFTTLKIYDVLGNEIASLVNEELPSGEYEVEYNPASGIRYPASGIYFYQLRSGDFINTKKMVLIK